MKSKPKGIFALGEESFNLIYNKETREEISKLVDIKAPVLTENTIKENRHLLEDVDVVFSGWGCPVLDDDFLKAAPNLKAVFYGAGSIRYFVTESFWKRGIRITSAYAANAVPVAEYTLSQILFSLKCGWQYANKFKQLKAYPQRIVVPGSFHSTVGIISLGMIGRMVCKLLEPFDIDIVAYDPFVSALDAEKLGVELCSLSDLFKSSDVVSLHTPWLKETEGMIKKEHFESMKQGAAFINTSRGIVICEKEMIEVLQNRPDLQAVLDVTYPVPPETDSPLYALPNVTLTPHIAGSMDKECNRMGIYMLEECKRYLAGEPMKWEITQEMAQRMA